MENRQEVQELTLEEVMGDRFGRYSKYIIQERALPDIRDGLKPVILAHADHRFINTAVTMRMIISHDISDRFC